jgi:hypothetical protein
MHEAELLEREHELTVTTPGNGGICFECPPRDEAGHVAVVKG